MGAFLKNWRIANDPTNQKIPAPPNGLAFPFVEGESHYMADLELSTDATLVIYLTCPRPIRISIDGDPVFNEGLWWSSFERSLRGAVILSLRKGMHLMDVKVGQRPIHHPFVDEHCPSRNRAAVMARVLQENPDSLQVDIRSFPPGFRVLQDSEKGFWDFTPDAMLRSFPCFSLLFQPTQFKREGILYQRIRRRSFRLFHDDPSILYRNLDENPPITCTIMTPLGIDPILVPSVVPSEIMVEDLYVPMGFLDEIPLARKTGKDERAEPSCKIIGSRDVVFRSDVFSVQVSVPLFELRGRNAPSAGYRKITWPNMATLQKSAPVPILPQECSYMVELYAEATTLLLKLINDPSEFSGLPNSYIRTSLQGFEFAQFVWDTSFTAMAAAYLWRTLPVTASLDVLYSFQFDGGYIHREHDIRDGLPRLFEPDFGPNPPLMIVAELAIARLTGDVERLRKVYPILKDHYLWIYYNRRLSDGTYWTTGLANGLDNSPSLGDGYPCLTSQMAQAAYALQEICSLLGNEEESVFWKTHARMTGDACNERLWSDKSSFYCASVTGGHNENKVVTGFWPLWAGIVDDARRVDALEHHALNPEEFFRHHPLPSLSADSSLFDPKGNYWLGSTWAPTNYAAIKGFWKSGRRETARCLARLHLQRMWEVFKETGHLWENYCSEESKPGSVAGQDYSWSVLGPVALLFEVVIGLDPDATNNRLSFWPDEKAEIGVRGYPLGQVTVDLLYRPLSGNPQVEVSANGDFCLMLSTRAGEKSVDYKADSGKMIIRI